MSRKIIQRHIKKSSPGKIIEMSDAIGDSALHG